MKKEQYKVINFPLHHYKNHSFLILMVIKLCTCLTKAMGHAGNIFQILLEIKEIKILKCSGFLLRQIR